MLFAAALLFTNPALASSDDTTASADPTVRHGFLVGIGGGAHIPVASHWKSWSTWPGFSARFGLPVRTSRLRLRVGIDAGKVAYEAGGGGRIGIVEISAGLGRGILPDDGRFQIEPECGVLLTALNANQTDGAANAVLIAAWESEFGFYAGIRPSLTISERWSVGVPLTYGVTLSGPRVFRQVACGVQLCMRWTR